MWSDWKDCSSSNEVGASGWQYNICNTNSSSVHHIDTQNTDNNWSRQTDKIFFNSSVYNFGLLAIKGFRNAQKGKERKWGNKKAKERKRNEMAIKSRSTSFKPHEFQKDWKWERYQILQKRSNKNLPAGEEFCPKDSRWPQCHWDWQTMWQNCTKKL